MLRLALCCSLVSLLLAGCSRPSEAPSASAQAPESYRVQFQTSKGNLLIEVNRSWAPIGADRFYQLVRLHYYDGARFFRVIPNFVVQFGINGDPAISSKWRALQIADDPVTQSNRRGYVSFATSGPNTRTTQVFINLADNSRLDARGFAPFGKVIEGMDMSWKLYSEYGEGPPRGQGPDQEFIEKRGNSYLEQSFPRLDFIKKAVFQ